MLGQFRIKMTLTNAVFPFFLPLSNFKLFGLKFSKSEVSLMKKMTCAVSVRASWLLIIGPGKNYNHISAERRLWIGMYPWLFLWQAAQTGRARSF